MILTILQAIVSVLLISAILLQMQGKGLSSTFGGGEFYRSRRSVEKFLIWATVVLTICFGILAVLLLLPNK